MQSELALRQSAVLLYRVLAGGTSLPPEAGTPAGGTAGGPGRTKQPG